MEKKLPLLHQDACLLINYYYLIAFIHRFIALFTKTIKVFIFKTISHERFRNVHFSLLIVEKTPFSINLAPIAHNNINNFLEPTRIIQY